MSIKNKAIRSTRKIGKELAQTNHKIISDQMYLKSPISIFILKSVVDTEV
jgi:hypothetical protein